MAFSKPSKRGNLVISAEKWNSSQEMIGKNPWISLAK
jgi:hypothetical protein